MLESGSVSPDDLVWYDGLPEWRSLSTLFPGVTSNIQGRKPTSASKRSDDDLGEESYFSWILDSFSYPFRGDGCLILAAGSIFLTVLGFLSSIGRFWAFSLTVFYLGYTASMLQSVLNGSGQGESVLPKWPDFTDWYSDIIDPALKWIGTFALVLGPGLVALFFVHPAIGVGLLVLGALYLPMAFMLVSMFDTLAALNPLIGLRSIGAIVGHYFLTLVVFGLLIGINALTGEVGDMVSGIPMKIVAAFIDGFNHLFSAVTFARILGGLYRVNRHRLGWF